MADVRVAFPFKPYPHQKAAHALLSTIRFIVLVWHRRGGKTVFAIMELVLGALQCKRERGRFGYIAPLLGQARTAAWDYLKAFSRVVPGAVVNESQLSVTYPNGAQVRLFGADNPDSLRGFYLDGCVLDEVADMKPNVWGEIIRPSLADRQGWAIFIGTPKGSNLFSELFYMAQQTDGWHAEIRRASETGIIPEQELLELKRSMKSNEYAQEFDCDFSASVEDVLLRLSDVVEAQERSLHPSSYSHAAKVLGVDIARYGSDSTVIQPRQGLAAFKPKWVDGNDTMQVVGMVAQAIDKWGPDATFIDAGASGPGVIDRLRQLGYVVFEIHFGSKPGEPQFENKRAEMWCKTADWIRAGGCLPMQPRLQADLVGPRYSYKNAHGKIQLESKDSMRARGLRSPDFGDALALTFAWPVPPRGLSLDNGRSQRGKALTAFDPYESEETVHSTAQTQFDPFEDRSF